MCFNIVSHLYVFFEYLCNIVIIEYVTEDNEKKFSCVFVFKYMIKKISINRIYYGGFTEPNGARAAADGGGERQLLARCRPPPPACRFVLCIHH
jgi:hypothetical protein